MHEDDRSFEELVAEYRGRIIHDLTGYGHSPEDADELANDALLAVRDKIGGVPREARWVYVRTAARRLGLNRIRHAERQRRGGGAEHVSLEIVGVMREESESVEQRLIREEEFAVAFGELSQESRLCVILKQRGYSSQEIAQRLGMKDDAVRSRISRAYELLRQRLGRRIP